MPIQPILVLDSYIPTAVTLHAVFARPDIPCYVDIDAHAREQKRWSPPPVAGSPMFSRSRIRRGSQDGFELRRKGTSGRQLWSSSNFVSAQFVEKLGTQWSRGLKDYMVEARVGKHRVDALADTGAQSNFVSAQFVEKLGLIPDDRTTNRIQLPGGKQVLSPSTVKIPFSFRGEREEYMLDCWVIPGCTRDLILSGPFLRTTKTLTTFKNRIKMSLRRSLRTRLHCNLLGDERQRLWGSLNGRSALALPDTGSDVMLISAEWATGNMLEIDHGPEHRLELELADGSRVSTSGIVHNAMWTFGDSAQDVCCDFYVLDDLCVDVVFSNDFIFELDVFSRFNHLMIDLDSTFDLPEFYNVRLISKYSQELARLEEESINDMNSPHARKAERVRRDQIRDAINTLDQMKQYEAWKEELQRRLIWDRHHEQHKLRGGSANAGQALQQVNGQYLPNSKPRWWKARFLRE
ncbi:hypothetical protein FHETE_3366 [Fusarium heterosporum]|uniref:Peptidase A2 domain-containing protein n=1 Tax=Fusarium heterosporum TaxID=42747 RepID=A0A8H5TQ19_FUSHE|nr:hypothetical protein FHETE_3366 [Fusarium heterosporum]